jgi:hypothetical protein
MEIIKMKKEILFCRIQVAGHAIKVGFRTIKYCWLEKTPWQVKFSETIFFLLLMSDPVYILLCKKNEDPVYSVFFHKISDLWLKLQVTEAAFQKDLTPFKKALLIWFRYPVKPLCCFKPITTE